MNKKNTFQNHILHRIVSSANQYANNNAFCINEVFYSYRHLSEVISAIRGELKKLPDEYLNIGIVANDDIETYAAIIAVWLEGKCYVPVNPDNPLERNTNVLTQAEVKVMIDSSNVQLFKNAITIQSKQLTFKEIDLVPKEVGDEALAYIFFTSGTTGIPKGVPISRANVAGFMHAFFAMGISMNETDKCLQMFELTFDLSVMSYLAPLLTGACVYTIPKNKIKFNYIAELMDEHELTVALMVPSIIHYLRPYFDEINCAGMKYSLFCGEALPLDVTAEWAKCIPNARVMNVYGPTEDTIFCTHYTFNRTGNNKASNGLLSIGKAMEETFTIIIDENNAIVKQGEKGQLCLGGVQLTPGYWKNEEKNKETFFYKDFNGTNTRFYKTGDLCLADAEGDIMYLGRIDSQIKVQGFRVELSEIEFFAKEFLQKINVIALAFTNKINNTEIGLVLETGQAFDTREMINYMKTKMPGYMIPTQIKFANIFPLNTNGKIDRKELSLLFQN